MGCMTENFNLKLKIFNLNTLYHLMGGIHEFFLVGLGIHIYIAVVSRVYLLPFIILALYFFIHMSVFHQSVHALKMGTIMLIFLRAYCLLKKRVCLFL